jgi:hypothetical protein
VRTGWAGHDETVKLGNQALASGCTHAPRTTLDHVPFSSRTLYPNFCNTNNTSTADHHHCNNDSVRVGSVCLSPNVVATPLREERLCVRVMSALGVDFHSMGCRPAAFFVPINHSAFMQTHSHMRSRATSPPSRGLRPSGRRYFAATYSA